MTTATDTVVRPARPDERRDIFASTHELAPPGGSLSRHLASCRRDRRLAAAEYDVAIRDGAIAGSVASGTVEVEETAGPVGVVFGLHVTTPCRRQGLGGRLLEAACERLAAGGCIAVYLRADADPRLFERSGFVRLPSVSPLDGAVAMIRTDDDENRRLLARADIFRRLDAWAF
ncbi:MAG: GNAT family N-acetyltransferase [Planctomycetota bacterium]